MRSRVNERERERKWERASEMGKGGVNQRRVGMSGDVHVQGTRREHLQRAG